MKERFNRGAYEMGAHEHENKRKERALEDALKGLRDLGVDPAVLEKARHLEVGGDGLSGQIGDTHWRLRREAPDAYRSYIGGEDGVSDAVEKRVEFHEQHNETELQKAERYWETRLSGETRIEKPQDPNCEFSFVIPVYNESLDRIMKQIDSLRNQEEADPSSFEIIYVINNDLPDGSKKFDDVLARNQALIEALSEMKDLNVFVVDKSSAGNEIPNCNVGRARNRGVAEASLRFHENGKNGILIQSDADTYVEDPRYLAKLREITKDEDVVGIAGGIIFEFSPDTDDPDEIAELRKKVELFSLRSRWGRLVSFLRGEHVESSDDKRFSGAHMISRSFPSAAVGGLIDTSMGEDPQFGGDIERYGEARGQYVLGMRNSLFVVTALRESDRTAASFKKDFDSMDPDAQEMVPDPFVSETLPEFRKRLFDLLEAAPDDPSGLRSLFTNEHGTLIVAESEFQKLVDYVGLGTFKEGDDFLRSWVTENFGPGYDIILHLYDSKHPAIPLNQENYDKLVALVADMPGGSNVVNNLTELAAIRMEE